MAVLGDAPTAEEDSDKKEDLDKKEDSTKKEG